MSKGMYSWPLTFLMASNVSVQQSSVVLVFKDNMSQEMCGIAPKLHPLDAACNCERPALKLEITSNVTNFRLCCEPESCLGSCEGNLS